jgi:curved DNA-binding protein CbpA
MEIAKRVVGAVRDVLRRRAARRFLGLKWNHSEYDLCEAYRALFTKYHPTRGGTVDGMRRLNEAFDVLVTKFHRPTKRQ